MNKRPLYLTLIMSLLVISFFIITGCSTEEPGGGGEAPPDPPKDRIAPAEVTELTASTATGSVTLKWQAPLDADFRSVEITFTPELSGSQEPLVVEKEMLTTTIRGLMNGTTYTFTVKTVDNNGNRSAGVEIMAAPDGDAPTAVISYPGGAYTKESLLDFTITFSEPVEGFTIEDILTTNCTLSNLVQHNPYTYGVKAGVLTEGELSMWIPANVVHDKSMNGNPESAVFSIIYDSTLPIPLITSKVTAITNSSTVGFSVTFPEEMTGFELTDLIVKNGSAGNLVTADNRVFTFDITPVADGEVALEIDNGAAFDAAGNSSVAAKRFNFIYDKTAPTSVISSTVQPVTNLAPLSFTVSFSEEVTGFELSDLVVTNGSASELATTDSKLFTFQLVPAADGEVTVAIKDAAAADTAGNLSKTAEAFTFTFDATKPQVQISSTVQSHTNLPLIPFRAVFTEEVKGFEASDIVITGGNAHGVKKVDALTYSFEVTPAAADVSLFIKEDSLTDIAGNSNIKSNSFSFAFDSNQPTVSLTTLESTETNKREIAVSINFSEAVTGFTIDDITALNCNKTSLTEVNSLEYKLLVAPTADGAVELSIAADIALDSSGNGNLASNKLSLVYDSTPPAVPTVTGDAKTMNARPTWSWNKPAGATAFTYRVNSGVWQNIDNADTTGFTSIDELKVGTHKFELKARDGVGNWSQVAAFSTEVYIEKPLNPAIKTFRSAQNELSWSNSNLAKVKYQVERTTGTGGAYEILYTSPQLSDVKSTTTYIDDKLIGKTTAAYRVKYFNSTGESAYSYWNPVTIPAKPPAPKALFPVSTSYIYGHIPSPAFTYEKSGSNSFELYISETPDGVKTLCGSLTTYYSSPTFSQSDYSKYIKSDGYYYYTARAYVMYNGVKEYSDYSDATEYYLISTLKGQTGSLNAVPSPTGKGALLTWNSTVEGETGFVIERKEGNYDYKVLTTAPANSVSYHDETACEENNYTYRVRATRNINNVNRPETNYSNEARYFKAFTGQVIDESTPSPYIYNGNLQTDGQEDIFKLFRGRITKGIKVILTSADANVRLRVNRNNLSHDSHLQVAGEGETVLIQYGHFSENFYLKVSGATPGQLGAYQLKVIFPPGIEVKADGAATSINGGEYNFQKVDYGVTKSHNFGLINEGRGVLNISNIRIIDDPEGSFQLVTDPATLSQIAAGDKTASRKLEVKFAPKTEGVKTATVEILSDSPLKPSYTFRVKGECMPPLTIDVKADGATTFLKQGEYSLGKVDFATAKSHKFGLINEGVVPLNISNIRILNDPEGNFQLVTDPATLGQIAAGDLTGVNKFEIKFAPKTEGIKSASIEILSDSTSRPSYIFTLNGECGPPLPKVEVYVGTKLLSNKGGSIDLSGLLGQTASKTVTIKNSGHAVLGITGLGLYSPYSEVTFDRTNLQNSIAPGASTSFVINYTPTKKGRIDDGFSNKHFEIFNNSAETPLHFKIVGKVVSPTLNLYDSSNKAVLHNKHYKFDMLIANRDVVTKEYSIINYGDTDLLIDSITLSDNKNFSIEPLGKKVVGLRETIKFRITIMPKDIPEVSTNVIIKSNYHENGGTYKFSISCKTIDPFLIGSYNIWNEGELPTSSDVKYYYFPVKAGKTYNIYWDEKPTNTGKYTGTIKISGMDKTLFTHFIAYDGEINPATFKAWEDAIFVLKVEAKNYFDSSHAGTFALKVTELP